MFRTRTETYWQTRRLRSLRSAPVHRRVAGTRPLLRPREMANLMPISIIAAAAPAPVVRFRSRCESQPSQSAQLLQHAPASPLITGCVRSSCCLPPPIFVDLFQREREGLCAIPSMPVLEQGIVEPSRLCQSRQVEAHSVGFCHCDAQVFRHVFYHEALRARMRGVRKIGQAP